MRIIEERNFLFLEKDWFTPNSYDKNFKIPTQLSGVYMIIRPIIEIGEEPDYEILYIGSAKNIFNRYRCHEVLRVLREFYGYVQFYFKEEKQYLKIEKQLIKKYQPRFNTKWR
jgi:excinuclease UvrABC nuclease subunit